MALNGLLKLLVHQSLYLRDSGSIIRKKIAGHWPATVSYTHLRAHFNNSTETDLGKNSLSR